MCIYIPLICYSINNIIYFLYINNYIKFYLYMYKNKSYHSTYYIRYIYIYIIIFSIHKPQDPSGSKSVALWSP